MPITSDVSGYVSDIFAYLSQGPITTELKNSVIDPILSTMHEAGAPAIQMEYDSSSESWLPSFQGRTYGADEKQLLIDDMNASTLVSDKVIYGTLSSASENPDYGADKLIEELANNTMLISGQPIGGNSMQFPGAGSRAILNVIEGTDTVCPEIYFMCGMSKVDVLSPMEMLEDKTPTTDWSTYKYILYQILKSGDGDALVKFTRSTTPLTGSTDARELFDGVSICNFNTAMVDWDDERPMVHPTVTGLSSGFALLQYDHATASSIEFNSYYEYGILLMNTSAAPLIFITADTSNVYRTSTTSLTNMGGATNSDADDPQYWRNEILLSPTSSEFYNVERQAVLAPIITPSSKDNVARRSKWLCLGSSDAYTSAYNLSAGFSTYWVDHGLCLSGGVEF